MRGASVRGYGRQQSRTETEEREMSRDVVERTFPEGVLIASGWDGVAVERNPEEPTPEAIRKAAARNAIPVDRLTQVRVSDPCAYARGAQR
jgi:hypothetical protein